MSLRDGAERADVEGGPTTTQDARAGGNAGPGGPRPSPGGPGHSPGGTRPSPEEPHYAAQRSPPEPSPGAPGPTGEPSGPSATPTTAPPPETTFDADDRVVALLEAEVAELKAKWLRARADYDNLARRTERDAALERERNKARILESFLPLLELTHMAAHQAATHPGPLSEGVVLLGREFDRFAVHEGLVAVRDVGVPFDAALHEAIAEEAVDGVAPGHVSRIVQPGYRLGDKVLRYAKVAVAPKT